MLNPIIINGLKPQESDYTVPDVAGLYLKIKKNGIKTFFYDFKLKNKRFKKVIGNYPDMDLKTARMTLQNARDDAAQADFVTAEVSSLTFADAFGIWSERKKNQVSKVMYDKAVRRIEMHLLPHLKNTLISDIKAPLLISIVEPLHKANKYETLRRCILLANEILNLCVFSGYLEFNPCTNILKTFKRNVKVENRASIHYSDLYKLEPLIKSMSFMQQHFFIFSLASLLRPIENATLKWQYIDFKKELIIIPADVMKMRKDHRVPIVPLIHDILNKMRDYQTAIGVQSEYVFYSHSAKSGHLSRDALSKLLRENGYRDELTPHGFRSIGRTFMADRGIAPEVAEACLAHVEQGITAVYQRSDFIDKRRIAMIEWTDFLKEQLKI